MKFKQIFFTMALMSMPFNAFSSEVKDYKILAKDTNANLENIYKYNNKSSFLGCSFDIKGKIDNCKKEIGGSKSKVISFGHVVSSKRMGKFFKCWNKKADKGFSFYKNKIKNNNNAKIERCEKNSELFLTMNNDMHNMIPVENNLNLKIKGSDYGFLKNSKESKKIGSIYFNDKLHMIMPNEDWRGRIARTYFYMSNKYSLHMSKDELSTFVLWNNLYPPTKWEKWKNQAVLKVQGNDNPYISHYKEIEYGTNR